MLNLNPLPLTWEVNGVHAREAEGPNRMEDYFWKNVTGCQQVRITNGASERIINGTKMFSAPYVIVNITQVVDVLDFKHSGQAHNRISN